MKAVNSTKDKILAESLKIARETPERMKGLLGRQSLPDGEGLLIVPCNSIHTVGMKFTIDAAFLDKEGRVVRLYKNLKPFRLTRIVLRARQVLELPAGTLTKTGTENGDLINCG